MRETRRDWRDRREREPERDKERLEGQEGERA